MSVPENIIISPGEQSPGERSPGEQSLGLRRERTNSFFKATQDMASNDAASIESSAKPIHSRRGSFASSYPYRYTGSEKWTSEAPVTQPQQLSPTPSMRAVNQRSNSLPRSRWTSGSTRTTLLPPRIPPRMPQTPPRIPQTPPLSPIQPPVVSSSETQAGGTTTIEKLSYKTIDEIIRNVYNYQETNASTALDILATYLRGQKLLYMESKTFCEQKLNTLMMPAIFISGLCTLLSLILGEVKTGPPLVGALNALNSFILAIISYLKLDAKAEAHKTSAYKFDKLQSYAEFNSGKILFKAGENNKFNEIITAIETGVAEIKETNQFIIPEKIRHRFLELYNINIFSEVKKIQNEEMSKINELKALINQNITIMNRTYKDASDESMIMENEEKQNKLIDEIIRFRDKYLKIDVKYRDEVVAEVTAAKRRCDPCGWFKS